LEGRKMKRDGGGPKKKKRGGRPNPGQEGSNAQEGDRGKIQEEEHICVCRGKKTKARNMKTSHWEIQVKKGIGGESRGGERLGGGGAEG